MLAVLVNTGTVLLGSLLGIFFGKLIKKSLLDALFKALALCAALIGILSAIGTNDVLAVIICMVFGTLLGELLRIDDHLEGAGDFIRTHVFRGKLAEGRFTEGFVTASLLFCVGSMTVIGSLEAGVNGNYSIIFAKSAMDFVSSLTFGAAMGIGVSCAAFFVLFFQGALTLLASLVAPYLSAAVVDEMSAVGGVILIGMALNMLDLPKERLKVANMLPAIFLPIAYLPLSELIVDLASKIPTLFS